LELLVLLFLEIRYTLVNGVSPLKLFDVYSNGGL
jgi:hypothetical protein